MRILVVGFVAASALLILPSASAKDFGPGDLRVCNATRCVDRFLSYGVHLERFARNRWYAVPRQLRHELRRLTVGLRPLRVTRAALAKSR
jgi:hypothetical protein